MKIHNCPIATFYGKIVQGLPLIAFLLSLYKPQKVKISVSLFKCNTKFKFLNGLILYN